MQALFPFLTGADGKISPWAAVGLAIFVLLLLWAFAKIPLLKKVAP